MRVSSGFKNSKELPKRRDQMDSSGLLHIQKFLCSIGRPTAGYADRITKNFCALHNTVEHNYISPSSTVGTQLHVSALYVGEFHVVI